MMVEGNKNVIQFLKVNGFLKLADIEILGRRNHLSLDGVALLPELPDHRCESLRVDAVLAQLHTDRQAVGVETRVQQLRYVLQLMYFLVSFEASGREGRGSQCNISLSDWHRPDLRDCE